VVCGREVARSRVAGSVVASDYVRLVSRSRRLQAESLAGMGLPGGARTRKRQVASGNKISVQFSSISCAVGIGTLQFSGSLRVNAALYPSKSGPMNKHIVKHIGTCCGSCGVDVSFHFCRPLPVQVRTDTGTAVQKHIVKHIDAQIQPSQEQNTVTEWEILSKDVH